MKSPILTLVAAALLGLTTVAAHAQNNRRIDEAECAAEAISLSGFDPAAHTAPAAKPSTSATASASPKGAATGSAAQASKGGSAQSTSQGQAAYNKAKMACMVARGYQAGQQP